MHEELALAYQPAFHITTPETAFKILASGKLFLPLADTNESEKALNTKSKKYYMSFARGLSSGYITDKGPGNGLSASVILVFDKEALSKARGVVWKAVDYWGRFGSNGRQNLRGKEAEERLFSNSQEIPINRALKEALIIVDTSTDYLQDKTKPFFSLCKKRGIPVKLFTKSNVQGILHMKEDPQDRASAVSFLSTIKKNDRVITPRGKKERMHYWRNLRCLVYESDLDKLTSIARGYLYRGESTGADLYQAYRNDISNLRNARYQEEAKEFDRMMKYMKAKSVSSFFDKLAVKWNAIWSAKYA